MNGCSSRRIQAAFLVYLSVLHVVKCFMMVSTQFPVGRRELLQRTAGSVLLGTAFFAGPARAEEEELPDFVTKAVNQYAPQLQLSFDVFIYDIQPLVLDTTKWGEINYNFKFQESARFSSVSRFERDFFSPMRNMAQALDDFGGEELLDSAVKFEAAMAALAAVTTAAAGGGVGSGDAKRAEDAYENGRKALAEYISSFNTVSGSGSSSKLVLPAADSKEQRDRYLDFKKILAKCQQGGVGFNGCQNIMEMYK